MLKIKTESEASPLIHCFESTKKKERKYILVGPTVRFKKWVCSEVKGVSQRFAVLTEFEPKESLKKNPVAQSRRRPLLTAD